MTRSKVEKKLTDMLFDADLDRMVQSNGFESPRARFSIKDIEERMVEIIHL